MGPERRSGPPRVRSAARSRESQPQQTRAVGGGSAKTALPAPPTRGAAFTKTARGGSSASSTAPTRAVVSAVLGTPKGVHSGDIDSFGQAPTRRSVGRPSSAEHAPQRRVAPPRQPSGEGSPLGAQRASPEPASGPLGAVGGRGGVLRAKGHFDRRARAARNPMVARLPPCAEEAATLCSGGCYGAPCLTRLGAHTSSALARGSSRCSSDGGCT